MHLDLYGGGRGDGSRQAQVVRLGGLGGLRAECGVQQREWDVYSDWPRECYDNNAVDQSSAHWNKTMWEAIWGCVREQQGFKLEEGDEERPGAHNQK